MWARYLIYGSEMLNFHILEVNHVSQKVIKLGSQMRQCIEFGKEWGTEKVKNIVNQCCCNSEMYQNYLFYQSQMSGKLQPVGEKCN
jgi:hypothetical protein